MSTRAKQTWVLLIGVLAGVLLGSVATEMGGTTERVVEVEICPACPQPPDCRLTCWESEPDCVLVETPCPPCPDCYLGGKLCPQTKSNEYGWHVERDPADSRD